MEISKMGKKSKNSGKIGVYQIRNTLNNMIYIGSSMNIPVRWREHKYDLRMNNHRNKHLQNAYNKYGKDAFTYEILELIDEKDKDKQFEREQYWINLKEACNKKKGYNIQSEVLIVPTVTKKVVCLETGEIFSSLREAAEAKKLFPDSISCCCNKRKLKQTGGYHWRFYDEYVNMTEEEIRNVIFDVKSYPFICLDDGKIYRSWRELPYRKGLIIRCCEKLAKKEYAKCKGKQYMFLKDYNKLTKKDLKEIRELRPEYPSSKEVICLETKKIYKNATRASKVMSSFNSTGILNCCYGKAITHHGLHWMFRKNYDKLSKEQIEKLINKKSNDKCKKEVVCVETKEVFKSIAEAASAFKVNPTIICNICKGKLINTHGYHFLYKKEYDKLSKTQIEEFIQEKVKEWENSRKKVRKKVRCIETSTVFESVTEAARSVGSSSTNISKCCKNQKYICKGFHWEYA